MPSFDDIFTCASLQIDFSKPAIGANHITSISFTAFQLFQHLVLPYSSGFPLLTAQKWIYFKTNYH